MVGKFLRSITKTKSQSNEKQESESQCTGVKLVRVHDMSAPVSSLSPWVDRRRGRCQMGISAELSVGNVVVQLRHKEFFVRRCFHVPFMLGELAANSGVTYLLLLVNSLWGVASRHIHIAVMTFRHGKAW